MACLNLLSQAPGTTFTGPAAVAPGPAAAITGLGRHVRWAVYLLAVAAFFELSARAILAVPFVFDRVAASCDAGWRLQWIRHRSHAGLSYTFDAYDPTRGWTLASNLRDPDAFCGRGLSSNSIGLRGQREYGPRGQERVLEVFGDSFTFGEDVGDDETYAALLGKLAGRRVRVMNFGVHGYGHDQMLLYLQQAGVAFRPDVVVLGFVDWDMERNLLAFRDYAKPRFDVVGGRLALRNVPVASPAEVIAAERSRSRFADLVSMIVHGVRRTAGLEETEEERVTVAILDEFQRTVESAGGRFVIAYLPVEHEIEAAATTGGESFVSRYCRSRGVPLVDVRPAFRVSELKGEHLKARGHWNRREHALAARALRAGLAAAGLL